MDLKDFNRFSLIFIDFHRFSMYFMIFHGIPGSKLGNLWQPVAACGTGVLAPQEEMLHSSMLGGSNIRVLEARGLAGLAGLA